MPELPDSAAVLAQFNRLIEELIGGNIRRHTFRRWEMEILLDIESCKLSRPSSRKIVLRRYQQAVQRYMKKGALSPLKLSEYLESSKTKPAASYTGTGGT